MLPHELKNERIVFLVLNWGLGHASRSAHLIENLKTNNELTLLSSGSAFVFLRDRFPDLEVLEIHQERIVYPARGPVWWKLLGQYRKIKYPIHLPEIESIYEACNGSVLISDNVYLHSKKMRHAALITHQLSVPTPWNTFMALPSKWFKHWENIWIPDDENIRLSGKLALHPKLKGQFIGFLSTWKKQKIEKIYDLGIICSGPEAHKKHMFSKYKNQVRQDPKSWMVNVPEGYADNDHLILESISSEELALKVQQTQKLIIRGGYSTLMDLKSINYQGDIIFHPHQGQLEQKYLQSIW